MTLPSEDPPERRWVQLVKLEEGDGLAEALHRFCLSAKRLLPALAVSVSVRVGDEHVIGGTSDDFVLEVESGQRAIDDGTIDGSPVASMVSLSVTGADGYLGSITVYGEFIDSFDAPELEADFDALRAHAEVLLDNAGLYAEASAQAEQLRLAMESRGIIEQAKGVLVARERIDPDVAWEYLVKMSQRSHRKLRDVAADVVQRASSGRLG
jgi:hypothetical protein